ncbi:MAG: dethiobiotin synthase [Flavobacteriaceae bacterium]|nr:dethiobiotin synthase [Flavobacteriaceae bacterium]
MSKTIFVTGISTEVGKTVVSAIITQALKADYWKPIQAGELDYCDSAKVENLIDNDRTIFYKNSFALKTPMSPHAAAEIENIEISVDKIKRPISQNTLVIEGSGGLLVPINSSETMIDLILPSDKVIVVSKNYLGSINHTLMTVEVLKSRGLNILGLVFNGEPNKSTEDIICKMTSLPIIANIEQEDEINKDMINKYSDIIRGNII